MERERWISIMVTPFGDLLKITYGFKNAEIKIECWWLNKALVAFRMNDDNLIVQDGIVKDPNLKKAEELMEEENTKHFENSQHKEIDYQIYTIFSKAANKLLDQYCLESY